MFYNLSLFFSAEKTRDFYDDKDAIYSSDGAMAPIREVLRERSRIARATWLSVRRRSNATGTGEMIQ